MRPVVHLVPALFGPRGVVGGAERYVFELARHMALRVPTRLFTFGDQPARIREGALDIEVLGPAHYVRGQRSNPIVPTLARRLLGATVVHCHQQHVLASSLAALTCKLVRTPVFVTELGGGGWDLSAYFSTDGLFDGHLHISEYSRRVFGHQGLAGAHVIYGGVDTEKFSPGPEEEVEGDTVLFVGRLLPHKGVAFLIDALPPEMRLRVVGPVADPSYFRELQQRAAGKQVEFVTEASDAELVRTYRRSLCVVLPSLYR
ncbi:MAG: glycosyltransferase family 4 protein, partial [Myxococcaceae bacterium]|nr:glycosyltransferase family 4 protein [Myxococcaceae bacterium]